MAICLFVNRLKPESIGDYSEYHKEAHKTRWKSQIAAIRNAGFKICDVYVYGDLSIVIMEGDDLDACFERLGKDEDNKQWQALMGDFFVASPKFDGTEIAAEKVFDLNAQYELVGDWNKQQE